MTVLSLNYKITFLIKNGFRLLDFYLALEEAADEARGKGFKLCPCEKWILTGLHLESVRSTEVTLINQQQGSQCILITYTVSVKDWTQLFPKCSR